MAEAKMTPLEILAAFATEGCRCEHEGAVVKLLDHFVNFHKSNGCPDAAALPAEIRICLTQDQRKKGAILLSGVPDSGKSLILEAIAANVPAEYLFREPLMGSSAFWAESMVGKKLALWNEVNPVELLRCFAISDLKKLMGSEMMQVNRKARSTANVRSPPIIMATQTPLLEAALPSIEVRALQARTSLDLRLTMPLPPQGPRVPLRCQYCLYQFVNRAEVIEAAPPAALDSASPPAPNAAAAPLAPVQPVENETLDLAPAPTVAAGTIASAPEDPEETLVRLKRWRTMDLITPEEYEAKRRSVLRRI
jgi:hypothetical protein